MRTESLWSIVLLGLFGWVAAGPGAHARPLGMRPSLTDREALALVRDIDTYRALMTLDLRPEQRKALLAIVRDQVADLEALEHGKALSLAQAPPALAALRTAVLANQGVSEEVKQAVRRAETPFKEAEQRVDQAIPDRAAAAWALLTTAQGAGLRRLERPRYEDSEAFIRRNSRLLARQSGSPETTLSTIYGQYGLRGQEVARAIQHGRPILQAWSGREGLVKRLLALPESGILDPKPDLPTEKCIARTLLRPTALKALDPRASVPSQMSEPDADLEATLVDIRVLNLVNSLYLTPEQMRSLSALSARAVQEYADLDARRTELARESLPALRQARDVYASGHRPDGWLAADVAERGRRVKSLRDEEGTLDSSYLAPVRALLTPNQIDMVANFIPCTVPVQSLTNPERVGQADSGDRLETILARLRALPEQRLPYATARLEARLTEVFKHKKLRDQEIAPVLARLPQVVAEARAMDDAEFAVKKHDLAQRIAPPEEPRAEGNALDRRLVDYLLSPHLIPIFETRLAAAR